VISLFKLFDYHDFILDHQFLTDQLPQAALMESPLNTLNALSVHLRAQAKTLQDNAAGQPESLEQYRALALLFDLVGLCDEAVRESRSENPVPMLEQLFWRTAELLKNAKVRRIDV
jgi:hypothetical protein